MKVTYHLSNEDIIALNESFLEQSPEMKRMLKRNTFVVPIFFLLIGLGFNHFLKIEEIKTLPISIILGISYYFFYPKWRKNKIIKSAVKNSQNVIGQNSLLLEDNCLTVQQPDNETVVQWRSISKVDETSSHFFIYTSEGNVLIVPFAQINTFEKNELINFITVKKDIQLNVIRNTSISTI